MNTPIPDARKLAEEIIAAVEGCTCFDCRDKAEEIIARALMAEREAADERAAKIASTHAADASLKANSSRDVDFVIQSAAQETVALSIASAIRDRSKT